jgi:hypothetical protein
MSKNTNFSKGVERLVDPITVGTLHFIQSFNRLLPKPVQQMFVKSSAKKYPYMGFVVEPYASFLFYEIADTEQVQALLPDGFELVKTKVFTDDEPKYYGAFGSFRAHTSAFWGARVELYIIAEDKSTGLLSWMIVDYDTNTISYDKMNGLRSPNAARSIVTVNHRGTVFVDVQDDDGRRKLVYDVNVEGGVMTGLDQRLWLEGNLSVGYGRLLSDNEADIFSLKFEALEVEKALKIPVDQLHLELNTWLPGAFKAAPEQVVCFPYAQHYLSDSIGYSSKLKSAAELAAAVESIDFDQVAVYSVKSIRVMFLAGAAVSFVITVTLLVLLLTKTGG